MIRNLLHISIIYSLVFSRMGTAVDLKKADMEDFVSFALSFLEKLPTSDGAPKKIIDISDLDETIRPLLSKLESYRKFNQSGYNLLKATDEDSLDYLSILKDVGGEEYINNAKPGLLTNINFLDFLIQSLERLLEVYSKIDDSDELHQAVTTYTIALWKEIHMASFRTAADLQTSLALYWKREDSNWSVVKKNRAAFGEHGISYLSTITPDVKRKVDFLEKLGTKKQAYLELSNESNQNLFYELCDSNPIVAQYFNELMLYQKISSALAKYFDVVAECSKSTDNIERLGGQKKLAFVTSHLYLEESDFFGILSHVEANLLDHPHIIDRIRDFHFKAINWRNPPNPSTLQKTLKIRQDELLKPILELAKNKNKTGKNRAKKQRKNKNRKDKAAAVVLMTQQPVSEVVEESALESVVMAEAEAKVEVESQKSLLPCCQKKTVESKDDGLAPQTQRFPKSLASDVILGHARGTVKIRDFRKFVKDLGGRVDDPRPNGMTDYYLPDLNSADRHLNLYHVHLPHKQTPIIYPAIMNHFIRSACQDAGFTKEMFE